MNFNTFQACVRKWAQDRGIYEHSTPMAQMLKAISETGELADAVAKNDLPAIKDAIGDVAVCLVNAATMIDIDTEEMVFVTSTIARESCPQLLTTSIAVSVSIIANGISTPRGISPSFIADIMRRLSMLAACYKMTFEECCAAAWYEIKDRKGHMIAGGVFVKE